MAAPEFRAGEAQLGPEHPQKSPAGFDLELLRYSVQRESDHVDLDRGYSRCGRFRIGQHS
jgi:hypothetical protein